MKTKILSMFMAIIMVLSMMVVPVFAEDEKTAEYTVTVGTGSASFTYGTDYASDAAAKNAGFKVRFSHTATVEEVETTTTYYFTEVIYALLYASSKLNYENPTFYVFDNIDANTKIITGGTNQYNLMVCHYANNVAFSNTKVKDLTITSVDDPSTANVECYTINFSNGGLVVGSREKVSVTLNNININQNIPGTVTDASTQTLISPRNESTVTLNNCIITTNGWKQANNSDSDTSQSIGFFQSSSTGGTINMNDCTIEINSPAKAENAIFASYQETYLNLNLHNVTLTCANTAANVKGFSLNSKSVVNLTGTTALTFPGTALYRKGTFNIQDTATINAVKAFATEDSGSGKTFAHKFSGSVVVTSTKQFGTYAAPTLLDGASVRIDGEQSGIRFSSVIAKDTTATAYGTVLVKATDVKTGDVVTAFTAESLKAASIKYAEIAATEGGTTVVGNNVQYNLALYNLPDYTTEYAARAYADYKVGDVTVRVYSAFDADENVRSIQDVAKAALLDVEDAKNEAEGYIYEVETDKWSCYTKAQYEALAEYANNDKPAA